MIRIKCIKKIFTKSSRNSHKFTEQFRVKELARENRKIEAIKHDRDETGVGLREASADYLVVATRLARWTTRRNRSARSKNSLVAHAPKADVNYRWSGQVIETNNRLPLGETSERQFAATGFGGSGMTFGILGSITACDAALGRKNPWLAPCGRRACSSWPPPRENRRFPSRNCDIQDDHW
jgi:glycine/D-amino acid oxidase-like deaminating enzyme